MSMPLMLVATLRALGVTQLQAGTAAGISEQRMSLICRGYVRARARERSALAAALNLDESDLFAAPPAVEAAVAAVLARRAANIATAAAEKGELRSV